MNRALGEPSAVLQSRQEPLKTYVKNEPAAVAMLDRHPRDLELSDRWCADCGRRFANTGRSHYEVFPDLPERWKQDRRSALEGETL